MNIFIIIALIIMHGALILVLWRYVAEMIRLGDVGFAIVSFIMIIINALMVLFNVARLTGRI